MGGLAKYALPIIGGYLVAHYSYWFRYKLARSDGHRYYFHIIYLAILLSLASVFLLLVIESFVTAIQAWTNGNHLIISKALTSIAGLEHWVWERQTEVFLLSFVLGPTTAWVMNRFPRRDSNSSLLSAIENREFDLLMKKSVEEEKPVLYTMATNHVYLGFNVRGPNPESQQRWIRILPLASGYRDTETKELKFTTYYGEILNEVWESNAAATADPESPTPFSNTSIEDFEVVLATDQIHSAHLFDVNVFNHFDPDQASNL